MVPRTALNRPCFGLEFTGESPFLDSTRPILLRAAPRKQYVASLRSPKPLQLALQPTFESLRKEPSKKKEDQESFEFQPTNPGQQRQPSAGPPKNLRIMDCSPEAADFSDGLLRTRQRRCGVPSYDVDVDRCRCDLILTYMRKPLPA